MKVSSSSRPAPGKNWVAVCGPPFYDYFAQIESTANRELPTAISETGNSINEVKAVILGHLHLDHAGGFEYFVNTDVEIYVHELERKHALTQLPQGAIMWYTCRITRASTSTGCFQHKVLEDLSGVAEAPCLGHAPVLRIMKLNLPDSETWIFTSDQHHIKGNYRQSHP